MAVALMINELLNKQTAAFEPFYPLRRNHKFIKRPPKVPLFGHSEPQQHCPIKNLFWIVRKHLRSRAWLNTTT